MVKRIYFDYAATTPMDKKVEEAMRPYFSTTFGNPGSWHGFGQEASAVVFEARRKIAQNLGVNYREILFTGSATEANNLALRGLVKSGKGAKIIVSAIEHESVLDTARDLKNYGAEVVVVPANKTGKIDIKQLEREIDEKTLLISIMYANNEMGVIQDIKKIAKIVKEKRGEGRYPLLHTDAVQAFQYLSCRPEELGVDLMTLSAHKLYGPKGVGILYKKKGVELKPIITGGGQEDGYRSGTENVAGIVGAAKAIELVGKARGKETKRIEALRDYFWKNLKNIFPGASLNGPTNRLANNLNFALDKISAESAITFLDLNGVAVSAGSACSARSLEISKVLLAMGISEGRARNSLRISLGRSTTKKEVDGALKIFKEMRKRLK